MTVFTTDGDRSAAVESAGGIGRDFDTSVMARTLAALFAAGPTLALLTLALPQPAGASALRILLVGGIAYVVAGLLLWSASFLPRSVLPFAPAWGATLITGFAYFSG